MDGAHRSSSSGTKKAASQQQQQRDEKVVLLPRRPHSRSAGERSRSSQRGYGTMLTHKHTGYRSTSLPVHRASNVIVVPRKHRQLTVPEQSAKLAEQASKKFFHGDFTSSHGAMFLVPPKVPPSKHPPRALSQSRRHVGAHTTAVDISTGERQGTPLSKKQKPNFGVAYPGALRKERENSAIAFLSEPIVLKQRSHSAECPTRSSRVRRSTSDGQCMVQTDTFRESALDLLAIASMKTEDLSRKKRMLSPTTIRRASEALRMFEKDMQHGKSLRESFDGVSIPLGLREELKVPEATPLRLLVEDKTKVARLAERVVAQEVSASEDFSSEEGSAEDVVDYGTALMELLRFAAPAAVAIAFTFSLSVIPLAFIGSYLGERELTGASVGYFLVSIFVVYPMIGLTFAMDTLCSHEYGRDPRSTQLGVLLQRGIVINVLFLIPMCFGIRHLRPIFASLYGTKIADVAMEFLEYLPWFLLPMIVFIAFNKFLSNQMQPQMPMIALTAGVLITPFVQMKLTPMGVSFTMIGMAITAWWQLLVLVVMTMFKEQTRHTLGKLALREALGFSELKDYLKLAIPSAIFVAAEASAFDVTVLIVAKFGEQEGAAWSSILNAMFMFTSTAGGLSAGACANIGRCIGSYEPESARRYIIVAVLCAISIGLLDSFVIVAGFNFIMSLFGTAGSTLLMARRVVWLLPFFHVADAVQFTFQGIFSGVGRNHWGALILLSSLWGVGIPLSVLFGVTLQHGFAGVCLGLTMGLCLEAPLMVVAVMRYIDYEAVCDEFMDEEWGDEEEEEGLEESDEYEEVSSRESCSDTSTAPSSVFDANSSLASNTSGGGEAKGGAGAGRKGERLTSRVATSGNLARKTATEEDTRLRGRESSDVASRHRKAQAPSGTLDRRLRRAAGSKQSNRPPGEDSGTESTSASRSTDEEDDEDEVIRRSGINAASTEYVESYSPKQRKQLYPPSKKKAAKKGAK